jgi:L-arabinose isomerase
MFDPHHNARDGYYLCRTTLAGSWEGLDKSISIANWNFGHRDKSLAFFAERGHKQMIAGYYDDPNVEQRVDQWRQAARGTENIAAVMYTTWRGNYNDLERFAKAVRSAEWR